jgi:putative transposase
VVEEQGKAFLAHAQAESLPVALVTRDNDQIYKKGFDRVMKEAGVESRRLAFRAPNTNAFVERFIQTLQLECLDHFLVFGEKHLDHLVREYVEHYHTERPHQGLGNLGVGERAPPTGASIDLADVERRTRLGGLLSHYVRRAA